MKLKTSAKKSENVKKSKSPKKQAKGVEVRKEKTKTVVKPTVLKKEGEKTIETPPNPQKLLQQELWGKAIDNVSKASNLSDEESNIAKLLADFKKKSSIPQKSTKLKNFITKGFSKFKDTSEELLDGIYNKISNEFKKLGGKVENTESKVSSKKTDTKVVQPKPNKKVSDEEMEAVGDDSDEDMLGDDSDVGSIEDEEENEEGEEEEEEEKPKPKIKNNKANGNKANGNKANNKTGKKQPNKGKNNSKFKGGKVQKNKKNK